MILVYIEVREGKVKKYSLEALSEAQRLSGELGTDVQAVLVGHNLADLAREALSYGAKKVHVLDSPQLSQYSPSGYAYTLKALVDEVQPSTLLFAGSSLGRDLAPRLAAKLGTGLISDGVQTAVSEGAVEVLRPIYAGKALLWARLNSSPRVITLRPNVFLLDEVRGGDGEVVVKEVAVPEDQMKDRVVEILREEGAALDVTEAEIIVSGGRGLKGPENFDLLRELAEILPHAAVGASRSAVDSEWIDHQHQVGQTGKTVSPNLYLAFGISGAIQHVAGMSSSKVIVAVNKDPEAPIFKVADFGIVGDLFQVIPPLKEELKKILSE
jgi:electron transfer flavoprotein alpha subunit